MSVDLDYPSFSNVGVVGTMHYNAAVTKKIPRGRVATAKFERLDILPLVVV